MLRAYESVSIYLSPVCFLQHSFARDFLIPPTVAVCAASQHLVVLRQLTESKPACPKNPLRLEHMHNTEDTPTPQS